MMNAVNLSNSQKLNRPALSNHAMRIEWDGNDRKQTEDAKTYYRQARMEGRRITNHKGEDVQAFRSDLQTIVICQTELKDGEFSMHILDETGDRRLIWRADRPEEVNEAAEIFDSYVKKGWKPYGVRRDGTKSARVRRFDPKAQEIYFDDDPKAKGESFKNFIKSFTEVRMLPKTTPG